MKKELPEFKKKRKHERVPVILEVSYRTTGGFLVSYSMNLSKGGIFIETDNPLSVGEELTLRLMPSADKNVFEELRGRVVWVRKEETSEGRPGMGIVFENIAETIGDIIDDLVSTFKGLQIVFVGGKSSKSRSHFAGRLRSILRSKVTEVGGKISAIDQLTQNVDLIVADLDRAGQEGLALLRWATDGMKNRPALVALASLPEMQETAKKLGIDEVISPKGSPNEFRMAVLRALSRPLIKSTNDEK